MLSTIKSYQTQPTHLINSCTSVTHLDPTRVWIKKQVFTCWPDLPRNWTASVYIWNRLARSVCYIWTRHTWKQSILNQPKKIYILKLSTGSIFFPKTLPYTLALLTLYSRVFAGTSKLSFKNIYRYAPRNSLRCAQVCQGWTRAVERSIWRDATWWLYTSGPESHSRLSQCYGCYMWTQPIHWTISSLACPKGWAGWCFKLCMDASWLWLRCTRVCSKASRPMSLIERSSCLFKLPMCHVVLARAAVFTRGTVLGGRKEGINKERRKNK